MPLPCDMGKCMSKVKTEFPKGRSDKKKGKKSAHKQHVAMCINAHVPRCTTPEGTQLTFKQYLVETAS